VFFADRETDAIHTFDLWKQSDFEDPLEISDRPVQGAVAQFPSGEFGRALPPTLRLDVQLAKITTSGSGRNDFFQSDPVRGQFHRLRQLKGRLVEVTTRYVAMTGVVVNVRLADDGKYDEYAVATVEVRALGFAGDGGVELGTVVVPRAATDPGVDPTFGPFITPEQLEQLRGAMPGTGPHDCSRLETGFVADTSMLVTDHLFGFAGLKDLAPVFEAAGAAAGPFFIGGDAINSQIDQALVTAVRFAGETFFSLPEALTAALPHTEYGECK
jgi:hypothetical protein